MVITDFLARLPYWLENTLWQGPVPLHLSTLGSSPVTGSVLSEVAECSWPLSVDQSSGLSVVPSCRRLPVKEGRH